MTKEHILVIEDHESIRKILGRYLSKQQYKVATMADGLEGLTWLNQGNIPDLIILDMTMPRVSGLEFLSNIRSSGFFRHIPVIVISGEEEDDYVQQCKRLGINEYIVKPFNPLELNVKIQQILN
ncbi:MAG: response regulator [Bacteroidota bacterium]